MPKPLRDSKYGVYKCTVVDGFVSKVKGGYIRGDHIGVFTWDQLIDNIIPDFIQNRRLEISQYPVLITSWRLKQGDPPKPIPMPETPHKLTLKSAGGKRKAKRMLGLPLKRKKAPGSETWQAVVYSDGRAVKVIGQRLAETELNRKATRGGNRHPIATKKFILNRLTLMGEDYISGLHQAYKDALDQLARDRQRKYHYHHPTYFSFSKRV